MIINLIHTLALATSVGLSGIKPNFKLGNEYQKQQNREIQTNYTDSYYPTGNITTEQQAWHSYREDIDDSYYKYTRRKQNMQATQSSGYLNIQAKEYTEISNHEMNDGVAVSDKENYYAYIRNGETGLQKYAQPYETMSTPKRVQPQIKLIALKINPTGVYRNVKINVWSQNLNMQGVNEQKTRYVVLTSTKNMEEYYNLDIENYSIYAPYYYLTTNVPYTTQNISTDGDYNTQTPKQIEFSIISNKTNYVFIYMQTYIPVEDYEIVSLDYYYGFESAWKHPTANNSMTMNFTIEYLYAEFPTQEVVDIGGLAFDVLGMPFTFISVAFNLTLFPGTPYELNVSTLFLSIFAVIVFVFIIKLILGAIGHK